MANTKAAKTKQDTTEKSVSSAKTTPKAKVPTEIDSTQYVTVRNGFQGKLIYRSKRTGEIFEWDSFGDEQEMELRELRNAKNSAKKFFTNNWFMFDEDWIPDYLGVGKYYKNAISVDEFDEIFTMTPAKLKKKLAGLSEGQRKSVAYRARELVNENKVDSISVINVLEEELNVTLVEK